MHTRTAAAAAVALTSVALITAPASGAVSPRATKPITLSVHDGPGGVIAKQGTPADTDGSIDGFKPGHGTVVTPTPTDQAMDLISANYRIVRTGPAPSLQVTYHLAGAFSRSDKTSQTATTYTEVGSFDGVATYFDNGYAMQTENDGMPTDTGLVSPRGKKIDCAGFRTTMKLGSSVATQRIPLSCLQKAHITASRLQAVSAHLAATISATSAGAMSASAVIATDTAAKTKRVALSPR